MATSGILREVRGFAKKRRSDEPTGVDIDTAFETALDYYSDNDHIISKLAKTLADAVWANAWRVRWGPTVTMRYFQRAAVRTVFQRQMIALRDRLRIKEYVGMWYYRDMRNWMRDFMAALELTNGASVASTNLLPYGPVEAGMGKFVRVAPRGTQTLDRQIIFVPASEDIDRIYAFAVFDNGAKFWPVSLNQVIQGESKTARRETHTLELLTGLVRSLGSGIGGTTGADSVLRPVSAFTALYEMSVIIAEAQEYTMTAALAGAVPLAYATAKAIPKDPIEEITDDNLAVAASINDAQTKNARENMAKFTLSRALELGNAITNALKSASGGQSVVDPVSAASLNEMARNVNALYSQIAAKYGRVNPGMLIRPIADFVEITPGREPHVDVDLAELRLAYELAVCREMDVPHAFYRTEVSTARTSGAPNLDLSEKIMADTIRSEQALYGRLFDWIYMVVFAGFDRELAASLVDDIRSMANDSPRLAAAQQAVRYMSNMINSDDSYARLEFELLTVRSVDSLKALIELQTMGIVDKLLVHRNAQNLFGHTLGNDPSRHALQIDPRLNTNFNRPLLPPVTPDTQAKLDATPAKEPAKKKQKTKHDKE